MDALGNFRDPDSLAALKKTLQNINNHPILRCIAAYALKRRGYDDAVVPLKALLQDRNKEVGIEVKSTVALLLASIGVSSIVVYFRSLLRNNTDDALIHLRCTAAEALGELRDWDVVDSLMTIMKTDSNTVQLMCVAAIALCELLTRLSSGS